MTQDEIIEMARQAGIPSANIPSLAFGQVETGLELLEIFAKLVEERTAAKELEESGLVFFEILDRTVARAVAKEREACANVCEEDDSVLNFGQCAAAIRARGSSKAATSND